MSARAVSKPAIFLRFSRLRVIKERKVRLIASVLADSRECCSPGQFLPTAIDPS